MALSEPYTFNASVSTTELSLSGGGAVQALTADGVYELVLDLAAMAKGDVFRLRFYEKAIAGGTQRVYWSQTFMGVQSEMHRFPGISNLHGWDATIQKVTGTDRTIVASIRQMA